MGDIKSHFTGYLMAALNREKRDYFDRAKKWTDHAVLTEDCTEQEGKSFEEQMADYLESRRQSIAGWKNSLQSSGLVERLECLKEKEQDIVFRRIFLQQEFDRIGKAWQMDEKQVRQVYHYAIRKMRRQADGI